MKKYTLINCKPSLIAVGALHLIVEKGFATRFQTRLYSESCKIELVQL